MRTIATIASIAAIGAAGFVALVSAGPVPGVVAAAHADEPIRIEANGTAESGDKARTAALDAAFADAVEQALVGLLAPEVRTEHRRTLRRKIVRRARIYVAAYKVRDEADAEGVYRMRIAATVDGDKLREQLAELEIPTVGAPRAPTAPAAPTAGTGGRPQVVLLLAASAGRNGYATFGARSDAGEIGPAVARVLAEEGFGLIDVAGRQVPVSRTPPKGVPIDDAAAARIAREAGAGGAFVIGVEVEDDGKIRGTRLLGAASRATVRVIAVEDDAEVGAAVVARAAVDGAGWAETGEAAEVQAALDAARRAIGAIAGETAAYWPAVPVTADGVSVSIRGYRGWAGVAAILKQLAKTRGVTRAWPRSLGRGGIVLAVDTALSASRIASAIGRAELPSGRASARTSGDRAVTVKVSGEQPGGE